MNVEQFTSEHQPTESDGSFQLENSYVLDVTVEGSLMAKAGSMISYTGDLKFTGQSSVEGGISGFLKDAATGEGTPVMTIEGDGHAYLAEDGKKIQILDLDADDSITVNGDDILAFEDCVSYEISTIDSLAGAFAGGFTNVILDGPGLVAITTHGDPLVVEPPVTTDPAATVAWSRVSPNVQANRSLGDVVGQESGETFQMEFDGTEGYVVVQPSEEH